MLNGKSKLFRCGIVVELSAYRNAFWTEDRPTSEWWFVNNKINTQTANGLRNMVRALNRYSNQLRYSSAIYGINMPQLNALPYTVVEICIYRRLETWRPYNLLINRMEGVHVDGSLFCWWLHCLFWYILKSCALPKMTRIRSIKSYYPSTIHRSLKINGKFQDEITLVFYPMKLLVKCRGVSKNQTISTTVASSVFRSCVSLAYWGWISRQGNTSAQPKTAPLFTLSVWAI